MKLAYIKIADAEYPLCLSLRAVRLISERFNGMDNFLNTKGKAEHEMLEDAIWTLAIMMQAGAKYINKQDGVDMVPPSLDDLEDYYGIEDFAGLVTAINDAITSSTERTVEAEMEQEAKNGEATRSN